MSISMSVRISAISALLFAALLDRPAVARNYDTRTFVPRTIRLRIATGKRAGVGANKPIVGHEAEHQKAKGAQARAAHSDRAWSACGHSRRPSSSET
jgi:hypothetical protein